MLKYRLIMMLAWLAVPFIFVQRIITGKDSIETFKARLGFGTENSANPKLLWLHAASLGEFNTLQLLLPALSQKFTTYDLLITVSNRIAFEKAKKFRSNSIHVEIAPVDFGIVVKKFLNHWNPSCLITIENEVYPNRTLMCAKFNIPVFFVNARMSEKSFKTWEKNKRFAQKVFASIDFCYAQDQNSFNRFADLGVPSDRMGLLSNLKQFQEAAPVDHPDLHNISAVLPYENTLCAASTHKGEDQIILDAFAIAKNARPDLKLILVPRHAKRSKEIEALMLLMPFSHKTRSLSELPDTSTDIYLADTVGEMPLWYSSAAVTFVAGSLVPVGGHTPYEPAAFNSAIIHGSQYSNFQAIYEKLVERNGSIQANTAEDIAAGWLRLLDIPFRETQIKAAKQELFENSNKDQMLGKVVVKVVELL